MKTNFGLIDIIYWRIELQNIAEFLLLFVLLNFFLKIGKMSERNVAGNFLRAKYLEG